MYLHSFLNNSCKFRTIPQEYLRKHILLHVLINNYKSHIYFRLLLELHLFRFYKRSASIKLRHENLLQLSDTRLEM